MSQPLDFVGKLLVFFGLLLAAVGGFMMLLARFGGGALPGDLVIRGRGFTLYLPMATMLVLSLILSLVLSLVLSAVLRR